MTTQDILELAARVEAATGPDRELDGAIHCALENTSDRTRAMSQVGVFGPAYTASLDAAMMLVPDNWTAWELRSRGAKARFVAEVSRLDENGDDEEHRLGHAATPALALTAASLKARAHTKGDHSA